MGRYQKDYRINRIMKNEEDSFEDVEGAVEESGVEEETEERRNKC